MKNLIFVFLGVLLFTLSCTKEEEIVNNNSNNNGVKEYLAIEIDPIETKILKFIDRMDLVRENHEYKGSEDWNYSKDSAIWYVEAVLNYKYSYVWQYSGNEEHSDLYSIDSSYTSVDANNEGDFNIVDLQSSYDALSTSLESQYSGIEAESKFFVLSDIMDLGTGNGSLDLLQYSVIGKANQVFSSTDWKWGLGMGDCSGNNLGKDATDMIERKLSLYRATIQGSVYINIAHALTPNNGLIYPDDVPLPSGQSNPTPFWNNLIFNYSNQWGNPCLSNSDMNWYKDNILDIENTYRPSGKGIIFTDVESDLTVPSQSSIIIHKLYPIYGEGHVFHYPDPID